MLIHVVQAAVTLRDAAVRQWATMSRDDQRALRGYVLHYVLRYDSYCTLACLNPCHAVQILWAAQTLLVLLVQLLLLLLQICQQCCYAICVHP